MRPPSLNEGVNPLAPPADAAGILLAVNRLLADAPEQGFFHYLVDQARAALGADIAWVLLTRDGESELIVAESSGAPLRQAAQAMHVALAAGGDAFRVDEGGGTLPDAPWFVHEGARACAARALRDPDGALRGHVALVFRRAVPAAAAYGDALGILASYARRSVLGYRELRRRADDWRGLVTQYEALFHSAPVLINAFDSDGRCTLWNEECERRFGWSIAEINRQDDPLALFYPDPSDRARVRESVDSAPCRAFREWHPLTRAGERLTVMWSNVSLPDGRIINIGLDATESRRAQAAIARMATVDSLTGCWNRAEILRRMSLKLNAARLDPGAAFTALMLDLDFFKQVNDRYGHLAGDAALRHFCDQLRACVRGGDAIGRLGGEEFLVLLDGDDPGTALAVCDRLREALRNHALEFGDDPLILSASGGIARFVPGDTGTSDVIRRADLALYRAKREGRDRAVVYDG